MISAKIVCDSISQTGIRLRTMELMYHRYIHSEFMTHRMFSRNAASTRAIPTEKFKQMCTAVPIHWGKNQSGMQAEEEIDFSLIPDAECWWNEIGEFVSDNVDFAIKEYGLHKQIVNRLLEPFQYIKVIVTATEWDNFFKLRLHPDAQPEIQELAKCMREAMDNSIPVVLKPGEWHLPYVECDEFTMSMFANKQHLLETQIKCSVARCARVSYLNHDNSNPDIAKDIALADKLLAAGHMSPFEHQAAPMKDLTTSQHHSVVNWGKGITHMDKDFNLWSGNFRGFLQYRQTI